MLDNKMYEVYDKSSNKIYETHKEIVDNFLKYSLGRLKYSKPVTIYFVSDLKNANNPLGKTAYYDHIKQVIVLFTDGRHFKDILRSLSHELVHHKQSCQGQFDNAAEAGEGYAQKDPHLRKTGKVVLKDSTEYKPEDFNGAYEKAQQLTLDLIKKKQATSDLIVDLLLNSINEDKSAAQKTILDFLQNKKIET